MSRLKIATAALAVGVVVAAFLIPAPASSQTPKSGGVMNVMQREDLPQGFSIHETATISTVWPGMPCFNNLVLFDPLKKIESVDTIIGELAERWSWQDNYRNLVFFLRKNAKWHDGPPLTSKDVKYTFDMVREAPDASARLRINPRKDWYANVEAIEAPDAHTVVFRLKRPQPSILMMLASGYSPVYPAHVPGGGVSQQVRRDGALQAQGVEEGRVRRVREEPRLLHQGPPLPRRPQVRGHRRAGHQVRRAPGGAPGRRLPGRRHQDHRRAGGEGRAADRARRHRPERERQPAPQRRPSRPSTT